MKALVTGANGFVGANLVRCLLQHGYRVNALVRETSDLRSLYGLDVHIVYGDIMDVHSLIRAAKGCVVIFHTAAFYSYARHSDDELMHTAREGTVQVLEAARERDIGRVVLTSSSVIFGSTTKPMCIDESQRVPEPEPPPYTLSKIEQDRIAFALAEQFDIEMVAACPTVCMGPHDYRLSESNAIVVNYLQDPLKPTWPGGCNIVSVEDVALGHLLIAEQGKNGCRYLMGSENLKWSEIHTVISEICGVPGPLITAGHTASFLSGAYHEVLSFFSGKHPPVTRVQAKMVGRYYWYTHKRMLQLGYQPVPARVALVSAISWLARNEQISARLRNAMNLSEEVYEHRRRRRRQ